MVQYIEAHDNLTLYDVIAISTDKDPEIPKDDREIHQRIRLGHVLVLTSQGTVFLHAGQEYGRTKQWKAEGIPEHKFHEFTSTGDKIHYYINDSHDSTDAVNMFEWAKVTDEEQYPVNIETRKHLQGLIELRKASDAFRLGSMELIDRNVTRINTPDIQKQILSSHTAVFQVMSVNAIMCL